MPSPTPSPVDLPERNDARGGIGWTVAAILVATLFLLAANAVSLRDWIDDRPPGPVQARAAEIADRWVALTEATGIAAPRDALHAQWKKAEAARFGGSDGEGSDPDRHR